MAKQATSRDESVIGMALGMVETRGMTGAVEAADAMVKTASVLTPDVKKVDGALVIVTVRGDIGAVQVAVEAGAEAARRVGELAGSHVIARPHADLEARLPPFST